MSSLEPDPSARRHAVDASRPLSAPATIGIAGLTAAIIVAVGVYVAERGEPPHAAVPAAIPLPHLVLPPEGAVAPPVIAAPPSTAVIVAAAASAAPSAAPSAAQNLPPDHGYLTAAGPADAHIYVNGVDVGPVGAPAEVPCGLRYVRIGSVAAGATVPTWLRAGRSVSIGCRAVTTVEAP